MNKKMKITAEIVPIPLERNYHSSARKNFLPAKSKIFRENLQWIFKTALSDKPLQNPLSVTLHFYKDKNITAKTQYGDIDNLVKAIFDAGNGILWTDDSQIVELHAYKHKGTGRIELEVLENE